MDPTQEVEELYARGTKEYKKAVQYILEDRVDCEISAHDDIILLRAFKTYAHEPKEKDNV